jgi:hypothetical protein
MNKHFGGVVQTLASQGKGLRAAWKEQEARRVGSFGRLMDGKTPVLD